MTEDTHANPAADGNPGGNRWYDYDPVLIEVLDLLRSFQDDVHDQAEIFIQKIEAAVGKEALEQFLAVPKPAEFGNRWYDRDPVIYKAVELLRVIPPDAQRKAAMHFLEALKKQGITKEVLKDSSK
jgi:hypothetical protein